MSSLKRKLDSQLIKVDNDIKFIKEKICEFKRQIKQASGDIIDKRNKRKKLLQRQKLFERLGFIIVLEECLELVDIVELCFEYVVEMDWCSIHQLYFYDVDCYFCHWDERDFITICFDDCTRFKTIDEERAQIYNMTIQDYLFLTDLEELITIVDHKNGCVEYHGNLCNPPSDDCGVIELDINGNHNECEPDCHRSGEECEYETDTGADTSDCPYLCKRLCKVEWFFYQPMSP